KANMLGQDDIVTQGHRSDEGVAEPNGAVLSNYDFAHLVVDTGKIFDESAAADHKLSEGDDVEPHPAPDDGAFSPPVNERVEELPYPPAWSCGSRAHQEV